MTSSAEYIIVGGGTAGLVVASRLSDNTNTRVVVLEAGPNRTDDPRVQSPDAYLGLAGSELDWKYQTVPQPELSDRELDHPAGKLVGGSSAINGCLFFPPSPASLNAWAALGSPTWNWESLRPYIHNTYTLHPSPLETVAGEKPQHPLATGSIQVTQQGVKDSAGKAIVEAWNAAFQTHGYEHNSTFLAEDRAVGTRPYTSSIDPVSGHRSSADSQYGAALAGRDNVSIVTGATVQRILLDSTSDGSLVATEVEAQVDGRITTFKASKEMNLAAGVFQSPKLLELSGIGKASLLRELGIDPLVDLPGVGQNMQNHIIAGLSIGLKPNPEVQSITPGIKAMAFVRLPDDVQQKLLNPRIASDSPRSSIIKSTLQDPNEASAILALSILSPNLAGLGIGLTFPFSSGSTHAQSIDPNAMPRFDAGFLTDNLDLDLLVSHVQQFIDIVNSDTSLTLFLQQCQIPTDRTTLEALLRASLAIPAHHSCGTAAMLPRDAGGVVGEDLKVYGIKNLRIVDASIFPLISNTNPMCTVYAVAAKAADVIKGSSNTA
ncbi:hypothetical protein BJX70DRAFT_403615 [Aspergillus crustosus]